MADLTPRQIVAELDRYIIGQSAAKRAVAVAIRNRWRRQQLAPELRDDITAKNIILIGPTGVGKTEIARRLAQLVGAPFLKIEATKYTEVGYHGRDVESMVRDLTENAVGMVKQEQRRLVESEAKNRVTERLIDMLLPGKSQWASDDAEEDDRKSAPDNHIPGQPAIDHGVTRIVGVDVADSSRAGRKALGDPLLSSVAGCG